jgi:hypothetical protein
MAEQGWYDAGEIKPRDIAPNPRCPDCQTGGMFHPAHPGRRCGVGFEKGCDCGAAPPRMEAPPTAG